MLEAIRIHPHDNIAIALQPLEKGVVWEGVQIQEAIPSGHKFSTIKITEGEAVWKYGYKIGITHKDVEAGCWLHSHNMTTALSGTTIHNFDGKADRVQHNASELPSDDMFMGFRRANGKVGTRNEIWVLNTVGCVTKTAERIAQKADGLFKGVVDGVYAFGHPFGCSQLGDDLAHTRAILQALMQHPNAGGVLFIGLGCENNQLDALLEGVPNIDKSRLRYFATQKVEDEMEAGLTAVAELVEIAKNDRREPCSISELVIGVKCGGSDGLSGITANPIVGRIADWITSKGGTVVQSEVPEMFGAETVLFDRCENESVAQKLDGVINRFKDYFIQHGHPIYENPSPGNKEGGLTTLEEKSLGAIQKGGQATITDVLEYGVRSTRKGLNIVNAPGNDGISSTAMVASGATMLLFTTGRGTPLGFPVPTLKIATNSDLAQRKPTWIDFNAGILVENTDFLEAETALKTLIIEIANGHLAKNEMFGYREIAIWKNGITL